ncbi:hypothetical protein P170DRAFT_202761 [Aspergillus steynii IBT 23096]|uniref:Uncharacterized protein n=1 Tax=Aspergillus steynii IBT 23096 TaxID=1392250 RepID=A0A2I2G551_9EURO|nr:uncharacterized protein P170DRAFT_202761 [Aspergillus steynii IBT 23096]PLB48006.1 hypothetical protein P170DRAFT_202761 [Aspergillus steynii IBT 23096]
MLGDHGSSQGGQDQDKMDRPAKRKGKNLIESTRLWRYHPESTHNGAHTRDPLGSSSPWDRRREKKLKKKYEDVCLSLELWTLRLSTPRPFTKWHSETRILMGNHCLRRSGTSDGADILSAKGMNFLRECPTAGECATTTTTTKTPSSKHSIHLRSEEKGAVNHSRGGSSNQPPSTITSHRHQPTMADGRDRKELC